MILRSGPIWELAITQSPITQSPIRSPSCIRRSFQTPLLSSLIAAAARSGRKTHWSPSIEDSPQAPTASSATCTCRATELSSFIMTACSIARRAAPDRFMRARQASWPNSTFRHFAMCLRVIPGRRIIVELKESSAELARAVVDEVRLANAVDHVCLGSFSVPGLRAVRSYAPDVATSAGRMEVRIALYRSWCYLSPGRVPYQAFQVPETSGNTRVVSRRFVELAHKAGLIVQVWTVDEPDDIRRLLDWGVDGIISDRPDVASQVLSDWRTRRSSGELWPR